MLAVTLGIVLLWGLFAPRSQWRALQGWSMSDPHGNEPSTSTYVLRQVLFAVGLVGMGAVALSLYLSYLASLPPPPKPLTPIEQMWGSPDPDIVNRVVTPLTLPPAGLVEQPILGFQEFIVDEPLPEYLIELDHFVRLGDTDVSGMIGEAPPTGSSALEFADMMVHVRGDVLCIPREVVVVETAETVRIAIYYGRPNADDGGSSDHASACPPNPSVSLSLLVPIDLAEPLGDREVQTLDGKTIQQVFLKD